MISLKNIKRSTIVVVLSVIILTIMTMNVSYSYFFSVQSDTKIQTFKAGTLDVTIEATKMNATKLWPAEEDDYPTPGKTPNEDAKNYAVLKVDNSSSNLDAEFSAAIEVDLDELTKAGKAEKDCVDLQYVKIGIFKGTDWINLSGNESSKIYLNSITGFEKGDGDDYPILRDTVKAGKSNEYRIYIWLDKNTPVNQIDKYVYLKLNVKSAVSEESNPYANDAEIVSESVGE